MPLFVVATPLGNLTDITYRALEVLKAADFIAAEDTRHSRKLLDHYGIKTPMIPFHEHNEKSQSEKILQALADQKKVALISDAGTPLISDPGYSLVKLAHDKKFPVIPIPGPCAVIAALSASGLPSDHFIFEGFLPSKGESREKKLAAFKGERRTVIIYESPHRILNLIELIQKIFGDDRVITVAREMTKQFETIKQGPVSALLAWMKADKNQQKGEFVVLLKGEDKEEQQDHSLQEAKKILTVLLKELSVKQAVSLTTQLTHVNKKAVYELALSLVG